MSRLIQFTLLVIMVSLSSSIYGEIHETNQISALEKYVNADCQSRIVFFNITGTLYKPSTRLSDHQWREYFADRVKQIIPESQAREDYINLVKNKIVEEIPKAPVETITPGLIAKLQDAQIPVFGITKKRMSTPYAENFGEITSAHLRSIGIELEKTLAYSHPVKEEGELYNFGYGILFTNLKPVAPALISFLENNGLSPDEIVVVDNTLESLEEIAAALGEKNIAFTGLRYSLSDEYKAAFDPVIGIIQYIAFVNENRIMSDEEASQMKDAHPDVDYQLQLDHLIRANF